MRLILTMRMQLSSPGLYMASTTKLNRDMSMDTKRNPVQEVKVKSHSYFTFHPQHRIEAYNSMEKERQSVINSMK